MMGKEVSIVLAGGGARGIAHIGVIEELEARDIIFMLLRAPLWGLLLEEYSLR